MKIIRNNGKTIELNTTFWLLLGMGLYMVLLLFLGLWFLFSFLGAHLYIFYEW
ncbi:MAG: hypothetical protein M0T81_01205 [Thermoplasmatales archaeon]|nr:hypothetical protein [Thermoplasmatales archaeon]